MSDAHAARILVCDDEPQILRALRVILRDAGFEAVTAATGEEALDLAAVKPPEAAILDLMLPDIDGVEVTRRLREWTKMPILVLSAVGEEDRKVEALAAGADDYVTKPFGPRELVARLEAVLRRAAPEGAEPKIVADGLEIDLAARTVKRDGEPVHLTPTEFGLLRTLARNRGQLMTHRALLVEVWGVEYEDDFQVLRAHIANLRRKIEPPDGPKYIKTDPGVGYRFASTPRSASLPDGRGVGGPSHDLYAGRVVTSCGLDGVGRTMLVCSSSQTSSPAAAAPSPTSSRSSSRSPCSPSSTG